MLKNVAEPEKPSVLSRIANQGFTLVESVVAMGMLSVVGILAISTFWKMMDLQRVSDRRVDTEQTRAQILSALSDSANCQANLKDHTTGLAVNTGTSTVDVSELDSGIPRSVFKSGGLSTLSAGPTYNLTLQGVGPTFTASPAGLPVGPERTIQTNRYIATLNMVATIPGIGTQSITQIPISMEFDAAANTLVSCTTNPDDTAEVLMNASTNTAGTCLTSLGVPYPTAIGMQCRFPVTEVNAANPAPMTCPGTFQPTGYVSSISRDLYYQTCSGFKTVYSGWHSFQPIGVEVSSVGDMKSGTSSAVAWESIGGSSGGLGLLFLLGVLSNPITAFLGLLSLISLAFTGGCPTQGYNYNAQPLAYGCF